jgi:hypothetical protein
LFGGVTILEGELAEGHRAHDAIEEKFHSLSDASADGVRRLVVSKKEHWVQFEKLSLLWARGSELCVAIVD